MRKPHVPASWQRSWRATAVGVPPFDAGNGFSCHSVPVTLVSTFTALLSPLSLGLLWRVRRTSAVLGDKQTARLHVSLAPRHAMWRRAYNRGTTGTKPPNAPVKPRAAAERRVRAAKGVETEADAKRKAATEGVLAIYTCPRRPKCAKIHLPKCDQYLITFWLA